MQLKSESAKQMLWSPCQLIGIFADEYRPYLVKNFPKNTIRRLLGKLLYTLKESARKKLVE